MGEGIVRRQKQKALHDRGAGGEVKGCNFTARVLQE